MLIQGLPQQTIDKVKHIIARGEKYHILSLGGGVQSSCLHLMNLAGLITPPFEFAVFADTQWERKGTYEYIDYLDQQASSYDFPPIMRVSAGNIRADMLADQKHYHHPPLYVDTEKIGQIRRQCTGHYKVTIINREIRKIFGMKRRIQTIGFSLDEIARRNDSRGPKYIELRYPLLEMRMTRKDCLNWMTENMLIFVSYCQK